MGAMITDEDSRSKTSEWSILQILLDFKLVYLSLKVKTSIFVFDVYEVYGVIYYLVKKYHPLLFLFLNRIKHFKDCMESHIF